MFEPAASSGRIRAPQSSESSRTTRRHPPPGAAATWAPRRENSASKPSASSRGIAGCARRRVYGSRGLLLCRARCAPLGLLARAGTRRIRRLWRGARRGRAGAAYARRSTCLACGCRRRKRERLSRGLAGRTLGEALTAHDPGKISGQMCDTICKCVEGRMHCEKCSRRPPATTSAISVKVATTRSLRHMSQMGWWEEQSTVLEEQGAQTTRPQTRQWCRLEKRSKPWLHASIEHWLA